MNSYLLLDTGDRLILSDGTSGLIIATFEIIGVISYSFLVKVDPLEYSLAVDPIEYDLEADPPECNLTAGAIEIQVSL